MFGIDDPTAVAVMPTPEAAGTVGFWTEGNPGTGAPATLMRASFFNGLQQELLNILSAAGLTPSKTSYNQILTALNMRAPAVGQARNVQALLTTASSSLTITADEVVVKSALGGIAFVLPNFNKSINLATTGAGGMDTGSAPVSGYVAIYAIYNPSSGTSALLATNATSAAQPNIYGGANMPAGYLASALLTVVPTNASSQFQACFVQDRHVTVNQTNQISTSTTGSNVSLVLGVPKNAKSADLFANFSCTAASNANIALGGNSSGGLPTVSFQPSGQSGAISAPKFPLSTPQNIWYTFSSSAGTPTMVITMYGWDI